jgi:hypothetical protein
MKSKSECRLFFRFHKDLLLPADPTRTAGVLAIESRSHLAVALVSTGSICFSNPHDPVGHNEACPPSPFAKGGRGGISYKLSFRGGTHEP